MGYLHVRAGSGLTISKHRVLYAAVASIILLFIFSPLAFPSAVAQSPVNFTPTDTFNIPAHNAAINFAVNGTYATATIKNDAWTFTDLQLNGSQTLSFLQVSAENSNVTIQYYRKSNFTMLGERFRYTAVGVGVQTIKIGSGVQSGQFGSLEWNVGVPSDSFAAQGKIWKVTSDGAIEVIGQTGNISIAHYVYMTPLQDPNAPFYQTHSVAIGVLILVAATVSVAVFIKVKAAKPKKEAT